MALNETPTLADVKPYVGPVTTGANNTVSGSTYIAPEEYKPPKEATVQGQMSGLLDKGSSYMESARSNAKGDANSRGLLNSTMAATAGEKAAIESALPIAQQDANAFLTAGMAGYQGKITGAQATQKNEADRAALELELLNRSEITNKTIAGQQRIAELDAQVKKSISADQIAANKVLSDSEIKARLDILTKTQAGEKALEAQRQTGSTQLETQKQTGSTQLETQKQTGAAALLTTQTAAEQALEQTRQAGATERADAQNAIEQSRITAAEKQDLSTKLSSAGELYSRQVAEVQNNPATTTEVKTTILNQIRMVYINDVNMLSALAGVTIDWVPPDVFTTAPPPPPPEGPVDVGPIPPTGG